MGYQINSTWTRLRKNDINRLNVIYEILDFGIPFLSMINIEWWKKASLYKHKLAKELNIYNIDELD